MTKVKILWRRKWVAEHPSILWIFIIRMWLLKILVREMTSIVMNNVMNEGFLKRVEFQEVKVAICFMGSYKTLGHDGLPLAFFQGL